MGRSTFEGPVLSGDNRFGPQRDVGLATLTQTCYLNFANTTAATAGFSGSSGNFVTPNNIPNNIATIYTPQAGNYSTNGPTVASAPTADGGGTYIYRGAVFLLPYGSSLNNIDFDVTALPSNASATASAIQPYVSNTFATATGVYATVASINAAGRTAATFTNSATQFNNAISTLQDVQNLQPGTQPSWFSQVVVTLQIAIATAPTVGQVGITMKYLQNDLNIGNGTTYPYGNFD